MEKADKAQVLAAETAKQWAMADTMRHIRTRDRAVSRVAGLGDDDAVTQDQRTAWFLWMELLVRHSAENSVNRNT